MFLQEWREFPFCALACRKINLMTASVSMLLKSRASLKCFRACFLPGRAKDLSAPVVSLFQLPAFATAQSCGRLRNIPCTIYSAICDTENVFFLSECFRLYLSQ